MKKIILKNISKKFSSGQNQSALAKLLKINAAESKLTALKNINLEIKGGETIGLVGPNGSGKSTLLRIIAGIYQPDSGSVEVNGSAVYFGGLSDALKEKLTVKENIYQVGAILGLKKSLLKKKHDEIIAFAELEKFKNTRVFQLSSGMGGRLNFAMTLFFLENQNPDIFLIDEVIEPFSDQYFKQKAFHKMEEFINSGATVIIANHKQKIITNYCQKAIFLEAGEIKGFGSVEEILNKYALKI